MITILHINSSSSWRGGEQQLVYLTENKQVNNIIFCKSNSALNNYCASVKADYFCFTNSFNFITELKKIIRKTKIDIIHLHDSNAHTKWYLFKQLTKNKIPAVLHKRVAFHKHRNYFSKKKYNDENIKAVICISETVKKETEKYIVDKTKIKVIHSGIDTTSKFENKPENKIPEIVITTALTEEKNLFEFIDIAGQFLKKKQARFYIFGDGKLKSELQQYIIRKNLQDHIFLKGFVKDINRQLYQYDVFLFTSVNEGFGTSLLDAMLSKVPVVTNNFTAVNEIIQDSKTGFIYKNREDAVYKIEALLSDPELKNTITENAFNFVQQFDITLMNQQTEKVYKSILTHD